MQALVEVDCESAFWCDHDRRRELTFEAQKGRSYQIKVDIFTVLFHPIFHGRFILEWEMFGFPPNDDFSQRIDLEGSFGNTEGSNKFAIREPGESDLLTSFTALSDLSIGGHSVWWSWNAPRESIVQFDTLGSDFDTILAIFSGDGDSLSDLSLVAVNDDHTSSLQSLVTFHAQPDTPYHIFVAGHEEESGTIHLNWETLFPPPNDHFENRIPLEGSSDTITFSNQWATLEENEPYGRLSEDDLDHTVWWSWKAPTSGWITFETTQTDNSTSTGLDDDYLISVFLQTNDTQDFQSFVEIGGGFSTGRFYNKVTFYAVENTNYEISIGSLGSAPDTELALRWNMGEGMGGKWEFWNVLYSPDSFAGMLLGRIYLGINAPDNLEETILITSSPPYRIGGDLEDFFAGDLPTTGVTGLNSLYKATFDLGISKNETDSEPMLRLRSSSEGFEQSDVLVIGSNRNAPFWPESAGTEYTHYFTQPEDIDTFRFHFDMAIFQTDIRFIVTSFLSAHTLTPMSIDTLGAPRSEGSFDFAGQDHEWNHQAFLGDEGSVSPIFFENNTGLAMRGIQVGETDASSIMGMWTSPNDVAQPIVLEANRVYRASFTVASDGTEKTAIPTFRARLNDSSFQASSYVNIESKVTARAPVVGSPETYDVYLNAPEALAGNELLFSFDYLYTGGDNDPSVALTLESIEVVSYSAP